MAASPSEATAALRADRGNRTALPRSGQPRDRVRRVRTPGRSRGQRPGGLRVVSVHPVRLLRRLTRLTVGEARLLAEAQYLLIACQFARWRRPVGQLLRIANESADSASGAAQSGNPGTGDTAAPASHRVELDEAALIAWAITRAADFGLFRPKCLVRSLALQRMLRRHLSTGGELRLGF